jgi:hypothetical protein
MKRYQESRDVVWRWLVLLCLCGCHSSKVLEPLDWPENLAAIPGDLTQLDRFISAEGLALSSGAPDDEPALRAQALRNARWMMEQRIASLALDGGRHVGAVFGASARERLAKLAAEATELPPLSFQGLQRRARLRLGIQRVVAELAAAGASPAGLTQRYQPDTDASSGKEALLPVGTQLGQLQAAWPADAPSVQSGEAGPTLLFATPRWCSVAANVERIDIALTVAAPAGLEWVRAGRQLDRLIAAVELANPPERIRELRLELPLWQGTNRLFIVVADVAGRLAGGYVTIIRERAPGD